MMNTVLAKRERLTKKNNNISRTFSRFNNKGLGTYLVTPKYTTTQITDDNKSFLELPGLTTATTMIRRRQRWTGQHATDNLTSGTLKTRRLGHQRRQNLRRHVDTGRLKSWKCLSETFTPKGQSQIEETFKAQVRSPDRKLRYFRKITA